MVRRNILITGSSGGIGGCIAQHLAGLDYNIALHYCHSKIDITAYAAIAGDNKVMAYQANLESEQEIMNMITGINKDMGDIDILINCAGVPGSGFIDKLSLQSWQHTLNIN